MPTAARGSMARAAQVWVVFSGRSEALLHAYIACVAKNGYKLPTANTSGKGASVPGRHRPDRQIPGGRDKLRVDLPGGVPHHVWHGLRRRPECRGLPGAAESASHIGWLSGRPSGGSARPGAAATASQKANVYRDGRVMRC